MPRSVPAAMMMTTMMMTMMIMMVTVSPAQARITCPPKDENQPDPTLEEIYYYSDVVVMGKVIEHHLPSGKRPPAAVYTAEMEVYCVYKGANVPVHINITDAGKPPHLCFETKFDVGISYMAYLKKHNNGRLTPTYPQHPEGYKDEMIFICDVNITLPVGLKKLPEGVQCEDKEDYEYPDYEGSQNVTCFSFHPKDDKDQTYKTDKTQDDEEETEDDDNGNEPLRMSLLLLALLYVAVLVFS